MVHPGHLWPAELSAQQRRNVRRLLESRGLRLTTLNMPNIDINAPARARDAYSLGLLMETVRLAGDLGARRRDRSGQGEPLLPPPRS